MVNKDEILKKLVLEDDEDIEDFDEEESEEDIDEEFE